MSGHDGSQQPANTRYDHDNINLQRLDNQPITQKKKMPKTFNQVWDELNNNKVFLLYTFVDDEEEIPETQQEDG